MSTQRSTWIPSWPSSMPESAPAPENAQRPPANPPPRAPAATTTNRPLTPPPPPAARAPVQTPNPTLGRPQTPPPASHGVAPHQTNSAVLADLARQARAARGELQAAQEAFTRRALALYETLRIVDDSLVQLATHVLGNSVIAATWFSSRNHHLNQRSPLEVLMVGDREAVVNELMRLEHGVY
jgi:Protein of unknown function (DUF2384)